MGIEIVPAYHHLQETGRLFLEYTNMLIAGDVSFKKYLDIQNYDAELEHLERKYGSLMGGYSWHIATDRPQAALD